MIEKAPEIDINDKAQEIFIRETFQKRLKAIIKSEKEYYYWDKVKYLKEDFLKPIKLWEILKRTRLLNSKLISIESISINYNINKFLLQKLHYLDFNFGAGLQKEKLLSDLDKQSYLNNALMEESIFSSMIEGATTTRVKAKDMLRKSKKPKNKSEQMILNNYKTIQYISKFQNEAISIEKLYDIHRLVTENTLENKNVGVFRNTNDVYVMNELTGEIIHTPPNFEKLETLMKTFCRFFNNNPKEDFIHPIVKGSILHFLIGYMHPFVDGNGRTARAIFYWYLLKNGYWLTEYLSISRVIMETKVQYEKAYIYTEIDDMDVTYFIHYQVKVLIRAFEKLKTYVANKKKVHNNLHKYLKLQGINERQATILQKIEEDNNRFFTVKEIENTYNVTNQTARTDIEELVKKEFLKKVAVNKKTFNYWKGNKFDQTFL